MAFTIITVDGKHIHGYGNIIFGAKQIFFDDNTTFKEVTVDLRDIAMIIPNE